MEFKTFITDIDLYGEREFFEVGKDDDITNIAPIEIEWKLEMEARDWGVKYIHAYAPDQTITLVVEYDKWDYEADDYTSETLEKTIELKDIDVDIDEVSMRNGLCPNRLEINFKTNRAELIF